MASATRGSKLSTRSLSSPKPASGSGEDEGLETIVSEDEDREYSPLSYDIMTYPVDFTLEVLVGKLGKNPPDIQIPDFQREFVWSQAQASKLIESFLLGLPVPPIFLFTDASNVQMVVDGQQRLKSIAYYFEGYFGPENQGRRPVFRLTGLNQRSPYNEMTYADLEAKDLIAFRKLNDSVLRAFVIKQLNPADHTSVFHIFERLNTGGTFLTGQEIRNCVYEGRFNDLLRELNGLPDWRELFGRGTEDKRMRDVELILRFFALAHASKNYKKPMKDFLSDFMSAQRKPTSQVLEGFRREFSETASAVRRHLGPKPFHLRAGLNAAAFDAVAVAFSRGLKSIPPDIKERYDHLKKDAKFQERITSGTTDEASVSERLGKAAEVLFG